MTWVALREAVYSWVNDVLNAGASTIPAWGTIPAAFGNVPIIFNYQPGPRPTVAYVGLRIITKRHIGLPYEAPVYLKSPGYLSNSGIMQALQEAEATVSIQGYGAGSDAYLEAIDESLHAYWWNDIITGLGLFHRDHSDIRDISMIIDEAPEQRFVFEANFGVPDLMQFAPSGGVPWIEFVDVSGVVTDPSGNNPQTLTEPQIGE